jgi:hypothetical protein
MPLTDDAKDWVFLPRQGALSSPEIGSCWTDGTLPVERYKIERVTRSQDPLHTTVWLRSLSDNRLHPTALGAFGQLYTPVQ